MPPRKKAAKVNEADLTKGEQRKLNALRKSLGPEIADKAFAEWLMERPADGAGLTDKATDMIADELMRLVEQEGVRIPRGGYVIRRGRGRVIVEQGAGE